MVSDKRESTEVKQGRTLRLGMVGVRLDGSLLGRLIAIFIADALTRGGEIRIDCKGVLSLGSASVDECRRHLAELGISAVETSRVQIVSAAGSVECRCRLALIPLSENEAESVPKRADARSGLRCRPVPPTYASSPHE